MHELCLSTHIAANLERTVKLKVKQLEQIADAVEEDDEHLAALFRETLDELRAAYE